MSRNILCAVYLLIAISTVHSASYYFRAGREVIVPTIEEVKEVISELKKEEPVAIEEILSVQAPPENIEAAVIAAEAEIEPAIALKSVPSVVESVVPIVENVENNVVVAAVEEPKQVVAAEVSDEARAKPNTLLRLETIEVVQPDVIPEKVATVAETVKIAAVQAIEKQNEESLKTVESAKPIEISTEVKEVEVAPVVKSVPVVENVEASVKTVDPVSAPVPVPVPAEVQEVVVPAAVEIVEKAQETVRSADPEPVKPEIVKEEKVEVPSEAEKIVEKVAEKSAEVPAPEIRQQPAQQPGPLDAITNAITNLQNSVQSTFQNAIQNTPIISSIFRPQQGQSDAPAVAGVENPSIALNTAEVAPTVTSNVALPATPLASSTTAPNFLQNVQNAISSLATNILRPTTAPAPAVAAAPEAAPPVIVSGTRGGDDSVEVVQHIAVDVNDKVDLTKQNPQ